MKLTISSPAKALSKAYLKQSLKREQIELFKANLARMYERIRSEEHEEHLKNIVSDFLKDTWYKLTNEINTSGRADLVIHNGTTSTASVGVLIEVKRPGNKNEMITPERPNTKALHELLHYYMQERYIKDNKEIRHLIVCNIHEWYIFDAVDFERFFFSNQKLVKSYKDWNDGLLVSTNTDWFYQEIAKAFIEKELDELPCTYFDLRDYVGASPCGCPTLGENVKGAGNADKGDRKGAPLQNEKKLIALYKLLSPPHLLKQTFANDSNSLNKEFYSELLHILGLEEIKDKGKKLIRRRQEGSRNDGSLLENTCNFLKTRGRLSALSNLQQYGADEDERCFSVALELCITWLNRLLFLKLLEGQLIAYHKGDRSYAFLNSSRIEDFDELNELFFEVLAVRIEERSESVRTKFGNIPYLNSSLFEESDLERATMRINELKNRLELPLLSATVLKGANGKRLTGSKSTLGYLFDFLDAYDFGAEGSADIQEQNKSIINASVLGLIFEKINGYKDGSFFTPGFITMYICRESIRRAVVRKFNDSFGWSCTSLTDLHNDIYRQRIPLNEANTLVNSLKICDPAVGSGHFLVSALNEIVAIKSELRILADSEGKLLRCDVTVENDELIVTVDDQIFEYHYKDSESQRIQETFFHEKEVIIENCLFGVDINPKSVAICRLRLWIELLKNAYYPRGSDALETLPNIDINIKCGNSLVSRFAISGNPNIPAANRKKLKELTDRYRQLVWDYKQSPSNKSLLRKEIEGLKHSLENFGLPNDKDLKSLWLKKEELSVMALFGFSKKETEKRQKLHEQLAVLERRFEEKEKLVYHNAFEWRFEFPEVLDNEGEFVGFDAVIGNPPYIPIDQFGDDYRNLFHTKYPQVERKYDSSVLFFIEGVNLLAKGGVLSYIAPLTWQTGDNYTKFRRYVIDDKGLLRIINLPFDIFEDAYVDTGIYFISAERQNEYEIFTYDKKARVDSLESIIFTKVQIDCLDKVSFKLSTGGFVTKLFKKLNKAEYVKLGDITKSTQGLAGSRFNKIDPEKHDSFPFLEKGNAYNYLLVKESTCSVDMSDKPSLVSFYQAEPKVLIRRIINRQDRLSVAYTEEKLVFKKDINPFVPTSVEYSAKYLLGILASKFISYIYVNSSVIATKDDFRQTTLTELRALPIPPATDAQQAPIIERVQRILATPDSPDVPALEAEIDRLVYDLYGLTEEEIAVVEGKAPAA